MAHNMNNLYLPLYSCLCLGVGTGEKNKSINAKLHYNISDNGITVSQGEQEADVKWYDIRKTVIVKDAVYVYMSPVRAFIFTKKQCGDDFGSLVGFIQEKVKQYKDYEPEETEENGGTDE